MIGRLIIKATLAFLTSFALFGGDMSQRDLGEYTPPAKLTYIEADAEQRGNELIFGNLIMELPEGVTAQVIEATDDDTHNGQIIALNDANELGFAPRIRIARYTAEYEYKEALISGILDLFPDAWVQCQYEDNREYVFYLRWWDYDYKHCYILVCGEDIYLVEELDSKQDYAFDALLKQGKVKWQDSGRAIKDGAHSARYFKITYDEDVSVICCSANLNLYCYLDGYFNDNGYVYMLHETRAGRYIYNDDLVDINFDGYSDIYTGGYLLVWEPFQKSYVGVKYPNDFPYPLQRISFPETKTIWGYSYKALPDKWDDEAYIQTIWRWEGFTLVKLREGMEERRENGVRVWAYEGSADNIMFDESFTWEEWENNKEHIQKLYEQFYDGLVPKEFFYPETSIPQEFLDSIEDDILNDTGFVESMINSKRLTDEEVYELAEKNMDIRACVMGIMESGYTAMIKSDVDNDGIEDIYAEIYWYGSGGQMDFKLFKGQSDETYKETEIYGIGESDIIEYEGKRYLIHRSQDFGKKFFNGYCLSAFENGINTERIELILYAKEYNLTLAGSAKEYEEYANVVMENAVSYDKLVERYYNVSGSAEELVDGNGYYYKYMCDLDNDGDAEYYYKDIWETSSMATDGLIFDDEDDDEGVRLIKEALQERSSRDDYNNAIMLWADDVDGETVVNVMYQTDREDFVIVGYVVSSSECREVYEIFADGVYGVKQKQVCAY